MSLSRFFHTSSVGHSSEREPALAVAVQACDRCQAAFGQRKISPTVYCSAAREHVAAALAAHAREHIGADERSQDVLQILLRNPLTRGDLFEGNAAGRLVLGQVDHNAQGISALCGNQHIYCCLSVF